jgi:hypothetical protein
LVAKEVMVAPVLTDGVRAAAAVAVKRVKIITGQLRDAVATDIHPV